LKLKAKFVKIKNWWAGPSPLYSLRSLRINHSYFLGKIIEGFAPSEAKPSRGEESPDRWKQDGWRKPAP